MPDTTSGWSSLPAEIRDAVEALGDPNHAECNPRKCRVAAEYERARESLAALLLPLVRDRERMDWLEQRGVDAIYFHDKDYFRDQELKPNSMSVRATLDVARGSVPGGETI